jgi:Calx-beta domain-containing protein
VRLSNASAFPISVRFATANGAARAPGDYYAKSGKLTFSPGTTSRVVSVWVRGDRRDERNETFFVNLSRAVNAIFADRQGRATIVDND